jgi:hypothetical protein
MESAGGSRCQGVHRLGISRTSARLGRVEDLRKRRENLSISGRSRPRKPPWLWLRVRGSVGTAGPGRLRVKQCQILFACLNFAFEMKQDRAAVAARRISCCGKRLFGTFEAGFDFLTARFASLRHAASPLNPLGPPTQGYPVWRAHTKLAAAVRRDFRGFQMNCRLQSRSRHKFDS